MYTQAMDIPDGAPGDNLSALSTLSPKPRGPAAVASPADQAKLARLQEKFDAVMDADGKIEPQDWMPEAYRKTQIGRAHV